jgi:hypothetical protein
MQLSLFRDLHWLVPYINTACIPTHQHQPHYYTHPQLKHIIVCSISQSDMTCSVSCVLNTPNSALPHLTTCISKTYVVFNFTFNKKLHFGELVHNLPFTCIHIYMNIINPAHVMKEQWGYEWQLHSFFTPAYDECEWSASWSLRKKTPVPTD